MTQTILAVSKRFMIMESSQGFTITRIADNATANFHGDDGSEDFWNQFHGDESPDDASENAEYADDFGDWCEFHGDLPKLPEPGVVLRFPHVPFNPYGAVVGIDADGTIVQEHGERGTYRNTGKRLEEVGTDTLNEQERDALLLALYHHVYGTKK